MLQSGRGFATSLGRAQKSKKIEIILSEALESPLQGLSILDLGTGSGEIAAYFGQSNAVCGVDVVDQRRALGAYNYVLSAGVLPFPDSTFDVVISNHVIEHVSDQTEHLSEVARVLKDTGVCYLATPNRLWPVEVHYRVPLLHYLPSSVFHRLLRTLGRFREEVFLLGYFRTHRLLRDDFSAELWSDRVIHRPASYAMDVPGWLERILAFIPAVFYRVTAPLHPTLIYVLRPRGGGRA